MSDLSKWLHKSLGLPEINLSQLQATSQVTGNLTKQAATVLVASLPLDNVKMLLSVCQSRIEHDEPAPKAA